MRTHFGLIGLALLSLASGLTACVAQPLVDAAQLSAPTATTTLPPAATTTSDVMAVKRTYTRTPSATPRPTHTATAQPTAAQAPDQRNPTAVLAPNLIAPPEPDGIARTADVPILMYHYISAAPTTQDRIRYSLSVPPEMFEAQLKLLRDNGFTTITLRDLYEYLAVGAPLPDKPVVLTFDDGYIDNYTQAFPILQKYGMTGTFFVLTGRADDGDPAYLSWDMIQEMSSAGMDIQLHARDHLDMRNRSYDWLVFQIIGGRQSIEGHTYKPVIFMAYPSGKYDANVLRFLRDTNFWAAVTTAFGRHHLLKDALAWDRVRISGQLRLQDFARLLDINVAAQRAVLQPTATLMHTPRPTDRGDFAPPTSTATRIFAPSTMTPTSTARSPLTPTARRTAPPDLTPFPDQTPERPPLPTPTRAQSPLITPTAPQSPITTPAPLNKT